MNNLHKNEVLTKNFQRIVFGVFYLAILISFSRHINIVKDFKLSEFLESTTNFFKVDIANATGGGGAIVLGGGGGGGVIVLPTYVGGFAYGYAGDCSIEQSYGYLGCAHKIKNGSSQSVKLEPGWSLVSTPRYVATSSFTSGIENFDIYILNPEDPSKWATMASFNQKIFEPLFGYYINNKTSKTQYLNLVYSTDVTKNTSSRTFASAGWQSVGFANPNYLNSKCIQYTYKYNSLLLQNLNGKFDQLMDTSPRSVMAVDGLSLSTTPDGRIASDINSLNNFAELKGYLMYLNQGASISGSNYTGAVDDCALSFVKAELNPLTSNTLNATTSTSTLIGSFILKAKSQEEVKVTTLYLKGLNASVYSQTLSNIKLKINGQDKGEILNIMGDNVIAYGFSTTSPLTIVSGGQIIVDVYTTFSSSQQTINEPVIGLAAIGGFPSMLGFGELMLTDGQYILSRNYTLTGQSVSLKGSDSPSYGYAGGHITYTPSVGPVHQDGTNIILPDGSLAMIIAGQKRPYTSTGTFLSYGFNSFSSVVSANVNDLTLPTGSFIPPQDGKIVCAESTKGTDVQGECSLISGGQKYPFASAATFSGLGFKFSRAVTADTSFLIRGGLIMDSNSAHLPGVLVNNNGTVQLMGSTGLLGIPDLATFNSWGYSFNDVVPANAADQAMSQVGVLSARMVGQLSPITTIVLSNSAVNIGNNLTTSSAVNPGTNNYTIWAAPFTVANSSATLNSILFKLSGTATSSDLQNYKLFIDGIIVSTTSSSNIIGDIIFNLVPYVKELSTGSHLLEVKSDIVGGAGKNFSIILQDANYISMVDSNNKSAITVSSPNMGLGFSVNSGGNIVLNNGTLLVQSDPNFTTSAIIKNSSNVTLGQWKMTAFGENIKINNLKFILNYNGNATASEGFNNLGLYINGSQVGFAQNAIVGSNATSSVIYFNSPNLFSIPSSGYVIVSLKGDLNLLANSSVNNIRTDLITQANSAQGVSSQNTFPSIDTTYNGSNLTVITSGITVAKNLGYANQIISPNSQKQKIGSFILQANNAENVRITSLTISINGSTTPNNLPNSLANLYIVTPDYLNGTTPINLNNINVFLVNFIVAANQTVMVDVYADVSNITGTIVPTLSGVGVGVVSNQVVSLSAALGQTITFSVGTMAAPTLLVSASTLSQYIAAGDITGAADASKASFMFVSTGGASTISELKFNISGSAGNPISSVKVGNISAPVVNNTAWLQGLNFAVPNGGAGLQVDAYATYAPVGANGVTPNTTALVTLTYVKYNSGGIVNVLTPSIAAPTMTMVGSVPTVTVNSIIASGLVINGENKIGEVTITASSKGAIKINTLFFNVAFAGYSTNPTLSLSRILDGPTTIVGSNCTSTSPSVITCNFGTAFQSDFDGFTISAGTSKTFSLYATSNGAVSSGPAVISTNLNSSSFSWDDTSTNGASGTNLSGVLIYNFPTNSFTIKQ